uniref:Uncharacterized protein n=1 Tax=Arundo donax TaxID=35708 RepID=A0A0A9D1P5_ARUDO
MAGCFLSCTFLLGLFLSYHFFFFLHLADIWGCLVIDFGVGLVLYFLYSFLAG